jgi:putative oxygen-independent coproporphyrinogen III oxidase
MTVVPPPLALYVHLPWCVRKCPYCDFNSHAAPEQLPVEPYLRALGEDLAAQAPTVAGREVISVFLGGGTPSLFPPAAIDALLARVRAELTLAPAAEITMEANPGTIERGRFAEYRAAGINRVSLGAQSFAPSQLLRLGRIHSADETRLAAQELHAAGIDNFNLDLMVGLPGQDSALACADVRAALELDPAHVSHYQLTLEPGTVFGALPPAGLPDHDAAADMQLRCHELLAEAGFARYETSAFARAGRRCTHNLNYWTFGDYLGVGAGAHGKRSDMLRQRIERTTREREPRRYMARGARGLAPSKVIRASEVPFEFMMNALRLTDGFNRELFEERTGLPWNTVQPHMARLAARGLAVEEPAGHWRASRRGASFLNELLLEFMDMPRASRPGLGRKTPEGPAA